ncbi:hypothetical protein HU230_0012385 [Bradyrhizobium quebecense]|uniref:Uncharacterized protein n=1 Tax=Bradyrhizobium quebecense TaxID=2748629 RepID=A0A974AAW1_9BRAD|nr:hypothetical protein [Bradyrhizobium quebecense]UGA46786.1 hypothetical protein HU230_0012385 [Bradyrhizobium quebecense]
MQDITTALEEMIDRHGLTHVVAGLSLICSEKADYIRANFQDRVTAKAWDADARGLLQCARLICTDSK